MMFAGIARAQVNDCTKDASKCIATFSTNAFMLRQPYGCGGGWMAYDPDGKGKCVINVMLAAPSNQNLSCKLARDGRNFRVTCSYPDPDFKKPTKE